MTEHRESPAVRLRPMTPDEFEAIRRRSIAGYAAGQVRAGSWNPDGSEQRAAELFAKLLPAGLDTPDTLLVIGETPDGERVGLLWLALDAKAATEADAWIYEIEVEEAMRGRGYGRALPQAAESECARRGAPTLGLSVLGSNAVARELYTSAGFEVVTQQMRKPLPRPVSR